jgi:hypothetical protein
MKRRWSATNNLRLLAIWLDALYRMPALRKLQSAVCDKHDFEDALDDF